MSTKQALSFETEGAASDLRRGIAEMRELDSDAIGRLIVDEALRRTLRELRHERVEVCGSLEELT